MCKCMQYIIIDLEWNQPDTAQKSIRYRLPFRLQGEIFQIGAVRLSESMQLLDEFEATICPVFFPKLNQRIQRLTGISMDQLNQGISFSEAMHMLQQWCGDDVTFLTWGADDKVIMEQNLLIHNYTANWIVQWIDLQVIYNLQITGDHNQRSLQTAMEYFHIKQTRNHHDALGDAYHTALIGSHLDLKSGILEYQKWQNSRLKVMQKKHRQMGMPALKKIVSRKYKKKEEVFADLKRIAFRCPICNVKLQKDRWIGHGINQYMMLVECENHEKFLIRLHLRKLQDGAWIATRLFYQANDEVLSFYHSKMRRKCLTKGR